MLHNIVEPDKAYDKCDHFRDHSFCICYLNNLYFFFNKLDMLKKSFLFEMTTLILGVLGSRLSLNVINIVVIVDS